MSITGAAVTRTALGGYFWHTGAIADLIRLARAGEAWVTIGRRFYPDRIARKAATAACEIFRRHASQDDRLARHDALLKHNWNKPRGFGRHAIKRRRRRVGSDTSPRVIERIDLFAHAVFADV